MTNVQNDIQVNFDGLLKLGYGIIDVRYRDYEVSNENLKYIITKIDGDRDDFYPEMLKYYIGRDVKDKNVYEIWIEILKHKIQMSNTLGRDVSIKVATIDYVENGHL
ncbi:MAG: hypothetical protein PHY08_08245 [Candidatus Cloacimonetes bacterium]|nr:hypothetical protein [Candidatus Cloacimonadota bacterium]MDD4156544.1 hypothetical protein [Candidatus Cloacimonadota bacterium]